MSDRSAKWTTFCPLNIDMNPLEVTSGLGELLNSLLRDFKVFAVTKMLANIAFQSFDSGNYSCAHETSLVTNTRLVDARGCADAKEGHIRQFRR